MEMVNISKAFAGNVALDSFDLTVMQGEVRVLVGANGSGKSTLIKILSGLYVPSPGAEAAIGGEEMHFGSPDHPYHLGCRFVHQDLGLIADLSVMDNLYLNSTYPTRLGGIRRRDARREASEALNRVGLDIDPMALIGSLSAAERTEVAVARAVRPDPQYPLRVLVLDEPTATLPPDEVRRLLAIVKGAAANGLGVLFVTHHLDEVYEIADAVTVLRDGQTVCSSPISEVRRADLVVMLGGDEPDLASEVSSQRGQDAADEKLVLEVTGLASGPATNIDLIAREGEILGIAGLTGSGRESILGAIFGATPRTAGEVKLRSAELPPMRPDVSMARGVGYLPVDRKTSGGVMSLSATENLTLADLRPFWRRLWLNTRKERQETTKWFESLDVRPSGGEKLDLGRFSGGNQQKILFAKWLRRNPKLMLLDDPTQGVDIGAKAALHRVLASLAATGGCIVLSSTDMEELESICHRVLVVRYGRVFAELVGEEVSAAAITTHLMSEAKANSK